jgi:hypothetical protein
MPRASRKAPTVDKTALYRAWTSFASDAPIRGLVVVKGMRLQGDHPFVQAFPHVFCPRWHHR